MALTLVEQLRLEIGLNNLDEPLLTEAELEYFLEKNKLNVRKAGLDAAKTVLFMLSQQVHERSGTELEIWGHTWFENYMQTLKLYLSDPNYSIALEQAKAYAGGISKLDIANNIQKSDNQVVNVDKGVPTETTGSLNTTSDVFDPTSFTYRSGWF